MDVMYTIVKVYVTERSDVIKSHRNVITICWTSAIEVTALFKHLCSEMKGVQEKDYNGYEGFIEKFVPRDHSLASLGKPRDARLDSRQ